MKSLKFFKPALPTTLAIVLASLLSVRPAQAGYTVTLQQVGASVVATGSGAIDLTGLTFIASSGSDNPGIDAPSGLIGTGPFGSIVDTYQGFTGPTSLGIGPGGRSPNTASGDFVSMSGAGQQLFVPHNYVSGAALSDSMTFNNATLATLGVTPGTYVWTWGARANQNFTLKIFSTGHAATFVVDVGLFNPFRNRYQFGPLSVTINPGDQVKWTWATGGHSVTSSIFNSGVRSQGATFTHTFNSVGTFPYHCTQHGEGGQVIVIPAPTPTPTPLTGPGTATVADFNGDGHPDYVLRNASTLQTAIWYLNNNVYVGSAYGPTLAVGWELRSVADFDRDSHSDYALFAPSTDQTAIWYLSGPTYIGSAYGPTLPSGWELVATGDFNGDSNPDYLLYNASTLQTAVWYLNNNALINGDVGPTLPSGWIVAGVADFDGDGHPDYLLFHPDTGYTAIWYLSGATLVSGAQGPTVPPGWALVATADFNGDGKPDYVLYHAATRQTAIWYLNNNVYVSAAYGPTLPAGWSLVGP